RMAGHAARGFTHRPTCPGASLARRRHAARAPRPRDAVPRFPVEATGHHVPHTGGYPMKLYPIALTTLLAIGVVAATRMAPHALRSHALKESLVNPVTVTLRVTPRQLIPLDTATIAAAFSTAGADSGPYTASLELL